MGIEGFLHTNKKEADLSLDDKRDFLLESLPSELQKRWESKLEDFPIEEQIKKLESIIGARGKKDTYHHESRLLPQGVDIFKTFPADMREVVDKTRTGERRVEIGYGKAGHVIADGVLHPGICYKMLFDDEILPQGTNDIATETEILQSVRLKMDGKYGVRVPIVYGFISEEGTRAITMELMNAPSLRKVVERQKEDMPKNFDYHKFFSALESFIKEMHTHGYYHRDLHAGNVLVDRETGMPCVIDFGLSKFAPIDDGETYRETVIENGHNVEIVLQSDIDNLENLKLQVKKFMSQHKELETI